MSAPLDGDSEYLLRKARRSLEAADKLLAAGHADFAVSRAYYAAFYAAEAFLLTRGLRFSRHSAVIAAFGRHGVVESGLPPELHRTLLDAFDDRNIADYGGPEEMSAEEASATMARVRDFLETIEGALSPPSPG